ncbi:hypothetical protein GCM10008098_12830 [Rhodanobacter panaciterrae]|uniref:Transposase n=1 Tax=Rhodanobacter panaciterrae TaxID=490572 RepID=A0ABQ2ZQ29_9GAMM|nr:hypothetical protein GCM10008098_12830 [Rhodanobacter panaciterrae]
MLAVSCHLRKTVILAQCDVHAAYDHRAITEAALHRYERTHILDDNTHAPEQLDAYDTRLGQQA